MNKYFLLIALVLISITSVFTQDLDKEIGFKYVKAEYLLSTERMEEAIRELNDVIKVSPFYKDALMLRAKTKYKLGAFKGAKDDILKSIDAIGITLDAAALLGKTEYAMDNKDAALNSLSAAIMMDVQDERVYELRASIYEEKDQLIKACEDWNKAADLGSTKGAINAKKLCGRSNTKPQTPKSDPRESDNTPPIDVESNPTDDVKKLPNRDSGNTENSNDQNDTESSDSNNPDPSDTNTTESDSTYYEEVIEDNSNIPQEDDTPNDIEIDEDLSLTIYGQGIGKRKILDRPSILILSDQTGTVAVEICINENGKVDYAEFNPSKSTLTKNSLVSLAIRKSKEFWFEKSDYEKQCGFILFNIKGSE